MHQLVQSLAPSLRVKYPSDTLAYLSGTSISKKILFVSFQIFISNWSATNTRPVNRTWIVFILVSS